MQVLSKLKANSVAHGPGIRERNPRALPLRVGSFRTNAEEGAVQKRHQKVRALHCDRARARDGKAFLAFGVHVAAAHSGNHASGSGGHRSNR